MRLSNFDFCTGSILWQNHYEILEVPYNATQKDIREAYLRKTRELHPDLSTNVDSGAKQGRVNKAVHDKFVEINEAYDVLSKSVSKSNYDQSLDSQPRPKPTEYRHYTTVEERAKAWGYKPADPNYYVGIKPWISVSFCAFLVVFGFCIHYTIAYLTSQHQSAALNKIALEHEERMKANNGRENMRKLVMKSDNANGDLLKRFEEIEKKFKAGMEAKEK